MSSRPSGRGRVDRAFHYQVDVAATLLELLGARVPRSWDGEGFAGALEAGREEGRDCVVFGQGAWTAQRAVRFDDYICISTYHAGYHPFPDVMLFDLASDPHQQVDLAPKRPDLVGEALARLEAWHGEMMRSATHPVDPMWSVVREGPLYVRGQLPDYLARLRATGRAESAAWLERAWPADARR
jgi:arylsulfatase A-like enzyme